MGIKVPIFGLDHTTKESQKLWASVRNLISGIYKRMTVFHPVGGIGPNITGSNPVCASKSATCR